MKTRNILLLWAGFVNLTDVDILDVLCVDLEVLVEDAVVWDDVDVADDGIKFVIKVTWDSVVDDNRGDKLDDARTVVLVCSDVRAAKVDESLVVEEFGRDDDKTIVDETGASEVRGDDVEYSPVASSVEKVFAVSFTKIKC